MTGLRRRNGWQNFFAERKSGSFVVFGAPASNRLDCLFRTGVLSSTAYEANSQLQGIVSATASASVAVAGNSSSPSPFRSHNGGSGGRVLLRMTRGHSQKFILF